MGRTLFGVSVALAAAAAAAGRAEAGAWAAPPEGQEILSSAVGSRNDMTVTETAAFWEVPFADGLSVVAAPWSEQGYDLENGWRAEMVVGVKNAVFREESTVLALQAGALWRSDPPNGCGEGGVEIRALAGQSWGDSSFVNVEAAARALEGGCNGGRFEITAGYRPAEHWLAMGQLFFDNPQAGDPSLKLQVSVVQLGDDGRAIQVGLRARLDGDDAEPTLVVGVWGRPGD